ncbi:Heat shock protein 4L [Fasciola gigantica]|uniref:Heat shock protein 4L n=1 Tax=Fasciola gigantica TaxID=46835 RepID=A0A504YYB0_FASGI|nr:Heat shock protein 4L [Fasciola gigantica]
MTSIQAVGFDIGTLNSFVCYATDQGLQTIHDDYGDRRIPTCVCFINGRRLVGMSAKMQHESARANTIWNFTPLLGRRYESLTAEEKQALPFPCRETIGGRVGIEVNYLRRVWILIPEQLLAIQLQHLRTVTEKALSGLIRSLVINVPVFYTDAQKRAVRDAAHIAGISPIRLITDTTAIATAYGFFRDGSLLPKDPPYHVAFVSIGYRSTQVAICSISKGTTRILATSYDEHLGGRDFDQVIFDYLREYLSLRYQIELECNGLAWYRLLKECEQLKIRMSASPMALPINLDGIADINTNRLTMGRGDFERLSEKLILRFRETILRCMSASGLQSTDIHAVELVGGSCRIPVLRKTAATIFRREATTTLNADEAVARGCAIHASMSSAGFEVRYRVLEPEVRRETKFPAVPSLISKELNDMRATEIHMLQQDRGQSERSLSRSQLEEYLYATKGRFEGQLKESVTPEERQFLNETESWIRVGAAERSSDLYDARLNELRIVVADVEKRHRLAKTASSTNATGEQKSLSILGIRPTKHEQIRRCVRHSISSPIPTYSTVPTVAHSLITSVPKSSQSATLRATEPVESVSFHICHHTFTQKSRTPSFLGHTNVFRAHFIQISPHFKT